MRAGPGSGPKNFAPWVRGAAALCTIGLMVFLAALWGRFPTTSFEEPVSAAEAKPVASAVPTAGPLAAESLAPAPLVDERVALAPAPLGGESASIASAETALASMIAVTNDILQRADGSSEGLPEVASGFVWGELQALAAERAQLGYRQRGASTIVSTSIRSVDLGASQPAVLIDVCIDSSGVSVVDSSGSSLDGLLYRSEANVLNIYGVHYIDGVWKISTHQIPENSTCS